jgi:uncharacterized protein (TIGR02996 family)
MQSTLLDGLFQGILDNPSDDAIRLVYADAMEEHGDEARAEFIRVQVELAKFPDAGTQGREAVRAANLRRRERGLWIPFIKEAIELLPKEAQTMAYRWECPRVYNTQYSLQLSRGFVSRITVPTLATWTGGPCERCEGSGYHRYPDFDDGTPNYSDTAPCSRCHGKGRIPGIGPALVAVCPLEFVAVGDREPYLGIEREHQWYDGERVMALVHRGSDLPRAIFRLLTAGRNRGQRRIYTNESAAHADLSAALLLYARGES